MNVKSIEVDGPTVGDATELGLSVLGIALEDAVVEVLTNSRPESSGVGVRVRVSDRSAAAVSRETAQTPDAPDPDSFPGKQAVVETFQFILSKLGIFPQVSFDQTPESFQIIVIGEGSAILIGRHGQTLEAIDYVLNRVAGSTRQGGPRVSVDVEGYRERREAALTELATNTAARVRESGRPVVLQPMSPRDRRIVHVMLQDDASVTTHSEGDGPFRTLVVSPKQSGSHS